LFIAARNAVAPVMLMTVWAWAEEANPRAAIPAKRLNFNFMWLITMVGFLVKSGSKPFGLGIPSTSRRKDHRPHLQ
jgi:hypothetical protein